VPFCHIFHISAIFTEFETTITLSNINGFSTCFLLFRLVFVSSKHTTEIQMGLFVCYQKVLCSIPVVEFEFSLILRELCAIPYFGIKLIFFCASYFNDLFPWLKLR
jgi:hypothetical protein